MAKLKDQVTPEELLEIILGGAMKNEVIKKYRTSDQELAVMLLPLFKSGELSKEEFNSFFKGVPLKSRDAAARGEPAFAPSQVPLDEHPSQILRSFEEEARGRAAEADLETGGDDLDIDVSPTEEPVGRPARRVAQRTPPVVEDEYRAFEPHATPANRHAYEAGIAGRTVAASESEDGPSLLDMILARLDSIDARLSQIEKKLSIR